MSRKKPPQADSKDVVASTLVTVGALNWGLVGLFGVDLVAAVFGRGSRLARLVYALVGVSAVYLVASDSD